MFMYKLYYDKVHEKDKLKSFYQSWEPESHIVSFCQINPAYTEAHGNIWGYIFFYISGF